MRAYHFVNETLRDGRPIPPDGEWLEEEGEIEMCLKGLHASRHVADALKYAPGNILCLVELDDDGMFLEQSDKVCASRRKIIARFDATELLQKDARESALSVIHLWNAPDIVKKYLETGDESLRAQARNAAAYATATAATAATATIYAVANAAYAAIAAATAATAAVYAATYAADAAYAAAAHAAAAYTAYAAYAADARQIFIDRARARLQSAVDAKFAEMNVK